MEARLLKRGETSGRSDDNAETIRKRFRTFVDQSLPVIDHYESLGKAHKIKATHTPDEVFTHVCGAIDAVQGGGAKAAKKQEKKVKKQPSIEAVSNGTPAVAFA